MTGIHTGVVRFQDLKRGLAALELEHPDAEPQRTTYAVIELRAGSLEIGDELVGNLDQPGTVDLFNRTRHDHVHANVIHAPVTREDAVAYMRS
jgi:hypothetical protein